MGPAFAGRAAECVDTDRPPRQNRPVHTNREMTDQEVALLRSKLTPMLERLAAQSGLSITMGKITYTRHNAVFAVEAAVRGEDDGARGRGVPGERDPVRIRAGRPGPRLRALRQVVSHRRHEAAIDEDAGDLPADRAADEEPASATTASPFEFSVALAMSTQLPRP
jgi:hypothetical protein